ncbi:MAG: hypothetical protein Q4A48_02085 [Bacillota bacterium]|nr:hypothetical protein [Bacillota bacterium]
MACFLVSAASAVAVTAAGKAVQHKEHAEEAKLSTEHASAVAENTEEKNIPFSRKLMWLAYMLWGGAFLLMFEHVWHGEVVPWFPFLTNASNPADAAEMLHEMATTGVCMALLIVAVWAGIVAATHFIGKRDTAKESA